MEPKWFFRSHQVLGFSRNYPQFIDSEGSSPCSQQPTTYPYPESHQSDPSAPNYIFKAHFNIILTSTSRSPKCSSPLRFHHQNPLCSSPLHLPTVAHAEPTWRKSRRNSSYYCPALGRDVKPRPTEQEAVLCPTFGECDRVDFEREVCIQPSHTTRDNRLMRPHTLTDLC